MLVNGSSRGSSVEKFLRQNETKGLTELFNNYLMKFEKKIVVYLPSLGEDWCAYIKNCFTANAQMLLTGTGLKRNWLDYNMMVLYAMCFLRNSYILSSSFVICNSYKKLPQLLFKHCCCFHNHGYVN